MMGPLTKLVDAVVSIYALGLFAYVVLGWFPSPHTDKARSWLGRLYEPVLAKLRLAIRPVRVGAALWDVTPVVLLVGLVLLKGLIIYLLPRGW